MSAETDDPGLVTRAYRTVTPGYRAHEEGSMNAIGWAVFLGIVLLMVPLLPFVIFVWLIARVLDALAGEDEPE